MMDERVTPLPPEPDQRPAASQDEASRPAWNWAWGGAAAGLALVALVIASTFGGRAGIDPEALVNQAHTDVIEGRWDQAEEALRTLATAREPTDSDRFLRARLHLTREQDDEALETLEMIPDTSPLGVEARRLAGQIELRRNRVRRAEEHFQAALRLDPEEVQARRELVYIYGMQLRRDKLSEQFTEMSKRVPLGFSDVFLWCLTRGNAWEATEQSATLEGFLDADRDDYWSRLALFDSYQFLGQTEKAAALLEPLDESDPEVRARSAQLAIARGDEAEAERLLAEGPERHAALARLRGSLALRRRDAAEAIRHFHAAEALEPDVRETLFGLARAYSLAGRPEQSQPYMDAAGKLETLATLIQYAATKDGATDERLPMQLGDACAAAGLVPEARAWYRLVLQRDPLNRDAQAALYRLDVPREERWQADDPERHEV